MGIVSTSIYADTVGIGERTKFERLWRSSQSCRENAHNKKVLNLNYHFIFSLIDIIKI